MKVHFTLKVIFMALPFLMACHVFALDPAKSLFQFNCRNWTRQNGLLPDKINSIVQSKDGYIWLGTQNGLVRFDGLDFQIVPVDLPQAHGQEVRRLVYSREGALLFSIQNGGFGGYNGKNFFPIGDERWAQPTMNATAILEARDGTIWTGADLATGRWQAGNPAGCFLDTTNTGIVISLCEDVSGRVWLGTAEHGLCYWANGKFVQIPDSFLGQQNIFALASDPSGRVWVGTGKGLRCYAHDQPQQIPALYSEVKALLVDSHGILWVGTAGKGLARYENGEFTYLTKADGLGSDYVTSLFEDSEGSLWIGTRDGLSQLTDLKFPIYTDKEGIGAGSSHELVASQHGGLWIANDSGVSYFDGKVVTNYSAPSLLENPYVKLVFEARNGDVYAEDGDKNINVISGGRLAARLSNQGWATAFAEDDTSVLVTIGTGDSLYRIQNGKLSHYQYKDGAQPDYYWVNHLCVARDGAIWVACKNGLFRIQAGHVKHWTTDDGLTGNNVQWICEDEHGTMWAGLAAGIARIKNDQINNIKLENGLADSWISAIVPDNLGYFWFDSGRGIFRISQQRLNQAADGKIDRVQGEQFNGLDAVKSTGRTDQENSGCKTQDGRIWFPCPWGAIMIDPAHIPINLVAPPVHIERVLADDKELAPDARLVVPPGKGGLEIHFTGLSLISPQNVRFRYQLVGYDKGWIEAGNRRVAFYTNLKPGDYTFQVIAANTDGVWNKAGDSVGIKLLPHFDQTIWFYLLCSIVTLTSLGSIYGWRVRHLYRKQLALQESRHKLEAEVTKRTFELAQANNSLQREVEEHRATAVLLANRTQLLEEEIAERERMQNEIEQVHKQLLEISRQAGMTEVATNVLHNVGNVLNSVNVSASLVMDNAKRSKVSCLGRAAALLEEHSTDLGAFMTSDPKGRQLPGYLRQLGEQLSGEQQEAIAELESLRQNVEHIKDIVAMQQNYAKISGVTEIVNVTDLVEDALRMNAGGLARHEVELIREFSEVPPFTLEKHKVLQILVNLIRNAKYACDDSGRPDKKIWLKVSQRDDGVEIVVRDNGVGIPPENLTRIFNHGFTTRKGGHGFGLHGGALAAKELGGALIVQSDGLGHGAIFTLTLPVVGPGNDFDSSNILEDFSSAGNHRESVNP